jgi:poly(3-hydroxyoctanoate) depolymerase
VHTGLGLGEVPGSGRILARLIPPARLHVIHGGGHLFILERPAEVAELVAQFLDYGGVA